MNGNILMNLNWNTPLDSLDRAVKEIASMVNLNPKILIQPINKK